MEDQSCQALSRLAAIGQQSERSEGEILTTGFFSISFRTSEPSVKLIVELLQLLGKPLKYTRWQLRPQVCPHQVIGYAESLCYGD